MTQSFPLSSGRNDMVAVTTPPYGAKPHFNCRIKAIFLCFVYEAFVICLKFTLLILSQFCLDSNSEIVGRIDGCSFK